MPDFPRKPMRGEPAKESLFRAVCAIIDFLPSLYLTGDNETTHVKHSPAGTTITAGDSIKTQFFIRFNSAGTGIEAIDPLSGAPGESPSGYVRIGYSFESTGHLTLNLPADFTGNAAVYLATTYTPATDSLSFALAFNSTGDKQYTEYTLLARIINNKIYQQFFGGELRIADRLQ